MTETAKNSGEVVKLDPDKSFMDLWIEQGCQTSTATPANSRAEAIGVKPLEWENLGGGVYKAPSPLFGSIRIEPRGSEYCVTWSVPGMCDTFTKGFFGTPDDAKDAAQADYEQRIRSALLDNPRPDSRAEAIGAREADSPLLAASYYAMSKAMELLDADLGHGPVLNMLAKCRVDIENRRALLDKPQPDSRAEAIGECIALVNGCQHDMGFDREIGPLGCDLENHGGCVCAGINLSLRALLQKERRK